MGSLVSVGREEQRIDKLFKVKREKTVLTPRRRKKLRRMGVEVPAKVTKEQRKEMGVKPRKKHREFRFFAVQQRDNSDVDDGRRANTERKGRGGASKERRSKGKGAMNEGERAAFDFESFLN